MISSCYSTLSIEHESKLYDKKKIQVPINNHIFSICPTQNRYNSNIIKGREFAVFIMYFHGFLVTNMLLKSALQIFDSLYQKYTSNKGSLKFDIKNCVITSLDDVTD